MLRLVGVGTNLGQTVISVRFALNTAEFITSPKVVQGQPRPRCSVRISLLFSVLSTSGRRKQQPPACTPVQALEQ